MKGVAGRQRPRGKLARGPDRRCASAPGGALFLEAAGPLVICLLALLTCSRSTYGAPEESGERSLEDLVAALGDTDANTRREAAYQLDQMGSAAKDAVPALIKALGDREQQVWSYAVNALSRIGPDAKEAIPALVKDLDGKSRQVWYRSAYALGRIGPAAIPALVATLADGSETRRSGAAKALGWAGAAAGESIPALLKALEDPSEAVRAEAGGALGQIGLTAAPALLAALGHAEARVRLEAARALRIVEGDLGSAWEKVVGAIDDQDASVRSALLPLLRRLGRKPAELVPILARKLEDSDEGVRKAAGEVFLKLPVQDAVPALAGVVEGDDPAAAAVAAGALARLGPAARSALPALLRALVECEVDAAAESFARAISSTGPEATGSIIESLRREPLREAAERGLVLALRALAPETTPRLEEGLGDPSTRVRAASASALAAAGPAARGTFPSLLKALDDPQGAVRAAAANALGALGHDAVDAAPALARVLMDVEPAARAAAVLALAAVGLEAEKVLPLLARALGDPDLSVRRPAAAALLAMGPEARDAAGTVVGALRDADADVRATAAALLARLAPLPEKEAAAAETSLALAAKDENEKARQAALAALGGIASPDGPGLAALRTALAGTNEGDSLLAASSLAKLGPRGRAAASAIETAFREGTPRLRAASAEALVRVLDDPGKTVPLLVAALKDKETDVRRAAASSLGQVGAAAGEAVPALMALLEDFLCRRAAFEALRSIGPRSVEILLKALDHRERFVSGYAAERLGELGADAAEAIPRLRALSRGGERRLQRTASEALAKIEAVVREF